MKKITTILVIALFAFSIGNAQSDSTMTNKNGYTILPQAGDIAVGMTMDPIFTYLGNMFNGNVFNGAPAANFNVPNIDNAVFVKYFLSDNSALRFTFEATANTTTNSFYVQDDVAVIADPFSNAQVTDIMTNMYRNYVIGFGYEMRRGSTRLQGVYGANILLAYNNTKLDFRYGNPMSADNPLPTTHDFGMNMYNGGRVLNTHNGEWLGAGANVFLGVEYFILPKISIGAEFSYGFMLTRAKQSKFDYEYWNIDHLTINEATDPGDAFRRLGTANPSSNFFIMFHF